MMAVDERLPCEMPNCFVRVPKWMYLCGAHARMVPVVEQRRVREAMRTFRQSGKLSDYHEIKEARARAIEAVRAKLHIKGKKN